ncbi:MAG: hypothetical protein AAF950_10080 [Pseudomonadota bacterium]
MWTNSRLAVGAVLLSLATAEVAIGQDKGKNEQVAIAVQELAKDKRVISRASPKIDAKTLKNINRTPQTPNGIQRLPAGTLKIKTDSIDPGDLQVLQARPYQPLPKSDREFMSLPNTFMTSISNAIWPVPDIPVCWEDMPADEADGRAWTKSAVEATWEKVSRIDFQGWDLCTEDSFGVRISVRDEGPHVTSLGQMLQSPEDGVVLNFSFAEWGQPCAPHREYCIRTLAVHEFGHVLGFAHEHNRGDRPTLCAEEPQGPMPDFVLTEYDSSSVMNYCSEPWNNDGRLSPLDVAGVRLIYGPFTEEFPARLKLEGSIMLGETFAEGNQNVALEIALTNDRPSVREVIERCNDVDLKAVVTVDAELAEDQTGIVGTISSTLLETEGCTPVAHIADANTFFKAVEPGRAEIIPSVEMVEVTDEPAAEGEPDFMRVFDADGPRVSISITASRMLGETISAADCTDCAAAASDAVFLSGPPPSMPAIGLENPSPALWAARSPWPDKLNVNFDVCADAVRAGPRYGGGAWPEAEIDRLCSRSPASREPAACYAEIAENGLNWGGGTTWEPRNIVSLCGGAPDTKERIRCFSAQLDAGNQWPQAIETCAST